MIHSRMLIYHPPTDFFSPPIFLTGEFLSKSCRPHETISTNTNMLKLFTVNELNRQSSATLTKMAYLMNIMVFCFVLACCYSLKQFVIGFNGCVVFPEVIWTNQTVVCDWLSSMFPAVFGDTIGFTVFRCDLQKQ